MSLGLNSFAKLRRTLGYWILITSQKFKHTTCEGAKRTYGTSYHKKRKYGSKIEVTTTNPLGLCGEKKYVFVCLAWPPLLGI